MTRRFYFAPFGAGDAGALGLLDGLTLPAPVVGSAWELGMHWAEVLVPLACSHCAMV